VGRKVRRPIALAQDVRFVQFDPVRLRQALCMDLSAARSFMATHARTLDRRRFELLDPDAEADPAAVLAAIDAYRNADGGYGWGLEPDLRSPESQPGGALHAFEAMADAGPATTPHAAKLCDWLTTATREDGGLPFALPVAGDSGVAPFWAGADQSQSSLQITAYVAAAAHRVAGHDAAAAEHPWLERATRYCVDAIAALTERPFAIALNATLQLADAIGTQHPEAAETLGRFVPANGVVPVTGGKPDEAIRPLDLAPYPDSTARHYIDDDAIERDLERLAGEQQDDGGWVVDFQSYSPQAELEWRGYATVSAVDILTRNG